MPQLSIWQLYRVSSLVFDTRWRHGERLCQIGHAGVDMLE